MRFAFISSEGLSLVWWIRLLAEGHEVKVWIKDPECRKIGEGIVEQADSYDSLIRWAGQEQKAIHIFDLTGFGEKADELRARGKLVLGDGKINDQWEHNRSKGERVAALLGLKLPKHEEIAGLDAGIKFMQGQPKDKKFFFKPSKSLESSTTFGGRREEMVEMLEYFKDKYGDMPGILQQEVPGVCIDTAWWWNGSRILGFIAMLEYKAAYNGDKGPATGSSTSFMWRYSSDNPVIARKLGIPLIEELFRSLKMCPGEYDINGIIGEQDKKVYFLEWGPRWGWDADAVYLQGLDRPLGESLAALAAGVLNDLPFKRGEYWGGVHIAVPPYPFYAPLDFKHSPIGVPLLGVKDITGEEFSPFGIMSVEKGLYVANRYGNVGVLLGRGSTVAEVTKQLYDRAEEYVLPDGFYRTDFGKHEKEDLRILKGQGFEVD